MDAEQRRRQCEMNQRQQWNLQAILQRQRARNRQRTLKLLNAAMREPLKLFKLHLQAKGCSVEAIAMIFLLFKINNPIKPRFYSRYYLRCCVHDGVLLRHQLEYRQHTSHHPHQAWCVGSQAYHCRLRRSSR